MAVGIFDSGLGGLTIFTAIRQQLPQVELIYLGDNAHAPYGERGADDIYQLTCDAVSYLFAQGCDLVILACNTASAVALRTMQETWVPEGKRVLGVFVPLIEALTERDWADQSAPAEVAVQQVGLFATAATISSRAFPRALAYRAIGVDVEGQPCSGLVDAIEAGDRPLAEQLVAQYSAQLLDKMPNPDAVVLGCTHYPLLLDVFARNLPRQVRILTQAPIVAQSLGDYLRRHPQRIGDDRPTTLLTTGNPQWVCAQAQVLFQRPFAFCAA